MQQCPAGEGLRAAKRPDWKPVKNSPLCQSLQPVAAVPCRGGFEGGQTSGLKAVKTQPIVPEPAGNGEKPSFEAPSRASGNRTPPVEAPSRGSGWRMQPYPAREGLRAAKRPDWKPLKHSPLCQSLQPVAAVPCRGGFEGGQTSGLKAVKTQPSVPKPARTVKSQVLRPLAEPVATVPRREAFEGGHTSGWKAGKRQPIVPKPAGKRWKAKFLRPLAEAVASGWKAFKTDPIVPKLAGKRWQAKVWGLPTVARLAEKQWKAELWRPSQSQWQAYPAGKPLKAAKRPDWKPLNQSPKACRKTVTSQVWGLPAVARLAEKQWKAELWRPSQSQWQAYPAGKPLKAAKRPDWKPLNQSPCAQACEKTVTSPVFNGQGKASAKPAASFTPTAIPGAAPALA